MTALRLETPHVLPQPPLALADTLIDSFGDPCARIEPLYEIIRDLLEPDDVRRNAAVELNALAAQLDTPKDLAAQLVADLEDMDEQLRACAAIALGWPGHRAAVLPLLGALDDEDEGVRRAAICALTHVGDDRLLTVLLDHLWCGSRDVQRTILENVWRFHRRSEDVADAYLRFVDESDDAHLRYLAYSFFGLVTTVDERAYEHAAYLKDPDARIRCQALRKLGELSVTQLRAFEPLIADLLADPSMDVKRAAMRTLGTIARSRRRTRRQ
jgi:HEAT repeat protein